MRDWIEVWIGETGNGGVGFAPPGGQLLLEGLEFRGMRVSQVLGLTDVFD